MTLQGQEVVEAKGDRAEEETNEKEEEERKIAKRRHQEGNGSTAWPVPPREEEYTPSFMVSLGFKPSDVGHTIKSLAGTALTLAAIAGTAVIISKAVVYTAQQLKEPNNPPAPPLPEISV